MGEARRASMVVLLAALVGFALGAAMLGFAALVIGFSFLDYVPGGIHSGWTIVVLFGSLVCFGLGGVAGAIAAAAEFADVSYAPQAVVPPFARWRC